MTTSIADQTEIDILDRVGEVLRRDESRLQMDSWHSIDQDTYDAAAECAPECGTTHCLAGWAQVFTGDKGDTQACGNRVLPVTCKTISLFSSDAIAKAWVLGRGYAGGDWIAEYERRGGRVIRDDGTYTVGNGDECIVLGSARPTITQSGGLIDTHDTSAPTITQSGGRIDWRSSTPRNVTVITS